MTRLPSNVTPRLVDQQPAPAPEQAAESGGPQLDRRRSKTLSDDEWFCIGRHVVYASMFYPIVVWVGAVVASIAWAISDSDLWLVPQVIVFGLLVAIASSIGAALITAFASAVTIALAMVVDHTLKLDIPPTLAGAVTGGWIGGGYLALAMGDPSPQSWLLIITATIMGCYGGAIGGWRSQWQQQYEWAGPFNYQSQSDYVPRHATRFRFGIRQMMIGSAWICGLLGIARIVGLLTPELVVPMTVWAVTYAVTLAVGIPLWPHFIAWRVARWERRQRS